MGLATCGCKSTPDPQLVYDRIFNQVVHGDLQDATKEVDHAYAVYRPKSLEWGWRFKVLKAQILITQSRAQETLDLLSGDLPASLAASDVAVRKFNYEGIAYRIKQDFVRAEERASQAKHLADASQPALLSEVLNARGAVEWDEQKFSAAELSFRSALDSARQYNAPRQQLAALGNLVRIAIINRQYGDAIDQSRVALRIARTTDMKSIEAALLGNLGWCYFQLGDFVNALDFFEQARSTSDRLNITGNSFYWEANVAESHQELHEYDKAKALLKRSLDNAARIDNKQLMTETLNSLVRLDLITGESKEAEEYNNRALQIETAGLDQFGVLETRMLSGRLKTLEGDFATSKMLFRQIIEDPSKLDSLKWEALAGIARMYDSQSSVVSADSEYRKSIELFEASRSGIEQDDLRISFLARGIESYDAYIDFLIRHNRPLDALKIADQSRSRTLAEGLAADGRSGASRTAPRLNHEQIAARLKATLLFYWIGEKQSHLWVITPAKITHLTLPAADQIDPLVKSYTDAMAAGQDVSETERAAGEKLYEMLVAPAQKLVPRNSRVVLLPDGKLYGLNFEALIVPEPRPHFWIEDITVSTASSLALLASAETRPVPQDKSLFLVGDTVPPNEDFPRLPQAAAEMNDVGKYFTRPHREVLSGRQATPAAYMSSQPEKFAYMHFVTHGTASRARPLESAVVMSKEAGSDSFKLYARDIVTRRLRAYLVTISACNGAGTRAYSGEGLVGLSWAFLRAGAHNVIGALWEVSDNSTPELMDKLYEGLSTGEDPATALRAAKLSLLHSDSVYRKPFYWAPFQVYAGS